MFEWSEVSTYFWSSLPKLVAKGIIIVDLLGRLVSKKTISKENGRKVRYLLNFEVPLLDNIDLGDVYPKLLEKGILSSSINSACNMLSLTYKISQGMYLTKKTISFENRRMVRYLFTYFWSSFSYYRFRWFLHKITCKRNNCRRIIQLATCKVWRR